MNYAVVQILSRCVLAFEYIIEDRLTANKNTAKYCRKRCLGNYIAILHTVPCISLRHPIYFISILSCIHILWSLQLVYE